MSLAAAPFQVIETKAYFFLGMDIAGYPAKQSANNSLLPRRPS
jgi:hypothetical protein